MTIGCVSIKHFPAWAIARARDLPRTLPVLVQEAGHVIALNRAAAVRGLHVGMTAARAASLCPSALIPTRDHTAERHAWEFALARLHRVTPFLEPHSTVIYVSAHREELRRPAHELGMSVGFAITRTLARLASIRAEPGQVLSVPASDTASFLETFPTRLLLETGFTETLIEQLEMLGCDTLGLVQRLTERHLTLAFGDEGKALYRFLGQRSRRPATLYREPPTVRHRFWIETPCSEPHDLMPVVTELAQRAADELPALLAGQIRITVSLEQQGDQVAGRVLPSPTADPHRIVRFAERLAGELFAQLGPVDAVPRPEPALLRDRTSAAVPKPNAALPPHAIPRRTPEPTADETGVPTLGGDRIDGLEIVLGSLVPADARQTSFFGERRRWVHRAVEEVHRRYPESIKRAVVRPGAHFHEDRFSLRTWRDS